MSQFAESPLIQTLQELPFTNNKQQLKDKRRRDCLHFLFKLDFRPSERGQCFGVKKNWLARKRAEWIEEAEERRLHLRAPLPREIIREAR